MQYYTTFQVMIVTQFPYIVSLVDYRLLGYSFYILLGYFCNLFSENAVPMVHLSYCYLLAHASTFIFIVKTGYYGNPKLSTEFARRIPLL